MADGKNTGDYLLELAGIGADAFVASQSTQASVQTAQVQAQAAAPEDKKIWYVMAGVFGVILLISVLKSKSII